LSSIAIFTASSMVSRTVAGAACGDIACGVAVGNAPLCAETLDAAKATSSIVAVASIARRLARALDLPNSFTFEASSKSE
jgi:hypothetical protein